MNSSCAKSHMSLPLPVHTLKRVLTPRTFVYIGILTKIHISYYRYFCVWLRVVRTHICLCHCECSQLEPLCIHRYTHKYTYFILQILLCMTPCCANSHMSVPLRVLTVRTSLPTYICHKYTYIPSQRLYVCISTRAVQSHTCTCHCGCSHLEPLCIQIFTTISIHILYHEQFCIWTLYVCALASAHS